MADLAKVNRAAIFRRGGSKTELFDGEAVPDQQELGQQLQELAVAWAIPKAKRGLAAAVWRPLLGAFEVVTRGRQQFNGQGFMHNKKQYLNVEEAVFMMDQAELLLLVECEDGQQRLLSMQEALHIMASLGISHDRLQVLAHLSRLGYHARRHPACWCAPAGSHPAQTWQVNPAWQGTDGLPVLPAPVAAAAASDVSEQQNCNSHQQHEGPAKKRQKLAHGAAAVATTGSEEEQQQRSESCDSMCWWAKQPPWLSGVNTVAAAVGDTAAAAVAGCCGQTQLGGGCNDSSSLFAADEMLGLQLQQRFPDLRPLPTYRCDSRQSQKQQQLLEGAHRPDQLQGNQSKRSSNSSSTCTAELVYDAIPCTAHFSYKCPPAPLLTFAMVKQGCDCVPSLDELLNLSAAAAAAGCGSTEGSSSNIRCEQHTLSTKHAVAAAALAATEPETPVPAGQQYSPVMVAMPDGSDVNYYQLRPISLMNLLTN